MSLSKVIHKKSFSSLATVGNPSIFQYLASGGGGSSAAGKKFKVETKANISNLNFEFYNENVQDLKAKIDVVSAYYNNDKNKPSIYERAEILRETASLFRKNVHDLALVLSVESGKTLKEARGEIEYGASYFEFYSEEIKRMNGDVLPARQSKRQILTLREPLGVVGIITPFNFPNAMLARKVSAAFAGGNSIVARPSEKVPSSAIAMKNLMVQAGMKPECFELVVSDRDNAALLGREMCENGKVNKISFTGSTKVGMALLHWANGETNNLKKASLELGGNAPFIVFPDVKITNELIEHAMFAKFRYSGQTCICANRFVIHESLVEEFTLKFVERIKKIKINGGILDLSCEYSSLIDSIALKKMQAIVADVTAASNKNLGSVESIHLENSNLIPHYFPPTIIRNMNRDYIKNLEIFGPIAPIISFKTQDEALEIANETASGLASYVFSNNASTIYACSSGLRFGMIGVNTSVIGGAEIPFGGTKMSGYGKEGSKYGLDDYTQLKYVAVQF